MSHLGAIVSYQVEELAKKDNEISRLRASNAELVEALEYLVAECDDDMDDDYNPHAMPLLKARAALKAAKGEA